MTHGTSNMTGDLQVLWCEHKEPTPFPCVDCGLLTWNFCDGGGSVGYDRCFAANRVANDYPAKVYKQMRTPLCAYCETCFDHCRFCRGVDSCTPPNRTHHWSGTPQSESRSFTEKKAQRSILREHMSRRAEQQRQAHIIEQLRQDEDDARMQQHFEMRLPSSPTT